jgi:DNA mismatch repair protein MutL
MSSIRLLPDRVANQIAAGEVVERPAAVIKELIENSLDAGAKRIEIEYRNGGKSYLRVEDDGHGMFPDEAMLSLERHATSKIREADDLQSITSFGFRGEALPSIASVSRFIMRTRAKGEDGGSEILVNGGKLIHQKDCGMPEGTRVEVARLFNSVPVRRKFLRTDATEATHVCRLARLYAMAHPETAFTLMENNRTIFRSPTCTDFKERLREIFGGGFVEGLTEVEAASDSFSLSGLMGKPGVGRSTRQEMIFMINNRPVDSKALSYAVIEAYHTYVPKGRYPPAFLFLRMEPSAVDVNVHPTKREVRFRDEGKLRAFVIRAIHDRLGKFADETGLHSLSTIGAAGPKASVPDPDFSSIPIQPLDEFPDQDNLHEIAPSHLARASGSSGNIAPSEPASKSKLVGDRDDMVASWRFLGKMTGELALFRTDEGLIVLHCRAALERLRFEEAEDAFSEEISIDGQRLLLPASLELDAMGSELLQGHLPMLKKLGFSIEEFGRNYHRIEAIPPWLDLSDAELFVRDLIALAKERGGSADNMLTQKQLLHMACSRGDDAKCGFEESEIILLVDRLLRCRNPLTCPQGHPTYVEYDRKEWEKRFCRRF